MSYVARWSKNWPEYLIEAWALGTFMVSAGICSVVFEYPGSAVHQLLASADLRRLLIGIAMGLTATGLIYSAWGKRSGAHMNPVVTLTFWRLGKVAGADALAYMGAQFLGGTLGVLLVWGLLREAFAAPPVGFAATLPGRGDGIAFGAELAISFGMMMTVLLISNSRGLAKLTGLFAGALVAVYIALEAPLSGMSMNPARSFASAAPAHLWQHLWIYFTAPPLGMLAAAEVYVRLFGRRRVHCGKLLHPPEVRCIHCGYEPPGTPLERLGGRLS